MTRQHRMDETTIHPAASNTVSLKATIPRILVNTMDLKAGDGLRWAKAGKDKMVVEVYRKGEVVKKVEDVIDLG